MLKANEVGGDSYSSDDDTEYNKKKKEPAKKAKKNVLTEYVSDTPDEPW